MLEVFHLSDRPLSILANADREALRDGDFTGCRHLNRERLDALGGRASDFLATGTDEAGCSVSFVFLRWRA
jgi:hypothetical protein